LSTQEVVAATLSLVLVHLALYALHDDIVPVNSEQTVGSAHLVPLVTQPFFLLSQTASSVDV
jgi:hypothetical protein